MTPERWFREQAPLQRWFADKGRTIVNAAIVWSHAPAGSRNFRLYAVELSYEDGTASRYFAALGGDSQHDVTSDAAFTSWLLGSFVEGAPLPAELAWERLAAFPDSISVGPGRSLGVQQSNTSIRYPGDLLIKVNRRLAAGPSPEVELSSIMQRSADRTATVAAYGSLWLDLPGIGRVCLAIASQFVPNLGDGWSKMIKLLRRIHGESDFSWSLEEVGSIADLTASMHRALASDPWRSAVAPQVVADDDIARWTESALTELEQLLVEFERLRAGIFGDISRLVELVQASVPELRSRLAGFSALQGTHRQRVHGDYHLGQVLRRADGTYVAIDFDGEPERPLNERRQKYAPLRDVAGMLRSFAYARGTVETKRAQDGEPVAILREWECAARKHFLKRYVAGVSNREYTFVPSSSDEIRQALGALELEKAVYECRYEINNRPDWLWLPLSRLVHQV